MAPGERFPAGADGVAGDLLGERVATGARGDHVGGAEDAEHDLATGAVGQAQLGQGRRRGHVEDQAQRRGDDVARLHLEEMQAHGVSPVRW